MGKKKPTAAIKTAPVSEQVTDNSTEPASGDGDAEGDGNDQGIDLAALDGYVLPGEESSEEEGDAAKDAQPAAKRRRRARKSKAGGGGGVLGADYREQEERRLEELLFGNLVSRFRQIRGEHHAEGDAEEDAKGDAKGDAEDEAEPKVKSEGVLPDDVYGKALGTTQSSLKPAWVDDDDQVTRLKDVVATYRRAQGHHGSKATSDANYRQHLEKTLASVQGQATPKWAQLRPPDAAGVASARRAKSAGSDSGSDSDADQTPLSKRATNLLARSGVGCGALEKERLSYKRLKNLNQESRAEGALIQSVEFHRSHNVALVAGSSGVVSLFQVDGRTNAKIQSIRFEKFLLHQAQWSAGGEELLATSSDRGHVQVHNVVTGRSSTIPHNKAMEQGVYKDFVLSADGRLMAFCGRFGAIHLLSARSKEWICTLKMNGQVYALAFSPDSELLYSHGEDGQVYVWDVARRCCVHRFADDGCVTGTALAVSPGHQYVACGSASGVVNVYAADKLRAGVSTTAPQPDKILLNLTTRASALRFHPSSELMALSSSCKDNAVKLLHLASMSVFANFPGTAPAAAGRAARTGRVLCQDFSPNGGYLGLGFNNGTAALYRLHHYDGY